jgi:aminoglycoside phosphotransferase (APT) family kinase protein
VIDLDRIAALAGARRAIGAYEIQSLWGGFGQILRVTLEGGANATVIAKQVRPPRIAAPDVGHARKLRSYDVEMAWYRHHAGRCDDACRVPRCLAAERDAAGWLFVLEDLDAAGFSARRRSLSDDEVDACLGWLASFHGTFVHRDAQTFADLWPVGTYWHLDTRQDELGAMPHGPLRDAARRIDAALEGCALRTLVHGDAKTANFCFDKSRPRVAAVDFQYVGGGCGMKDVVYFFSCLGPARCESSAERWLDTYFARLRASLRDPALDADDLETQWRALVPFAWADLERFLAGWSPGHHDRYAEARTREVLRSPQGTSGSGGGGGAP